MYMKKMYVLIYSKKIYEISSFGLVWGGGVLELDWDFGNNGRGQSVHASRSVPYKVKVLGWLG
jgi:hypothetical protein